MCVTIVTTHECGHEDKDLFLCEKIIDNLNEPCAEPSTKETSSPDACPNCAEDAHLTAALQRIEKDASLAPVTAAPHRLAKTREWYPKCGHYSNQVIQDFALQDGPEWINEEFPGMCRGCSMALIRDIERMKSEGRWGDDPWGELGKAATVEEVRVEGGNVGSSNGPADGAGAAVGSAGGSSSRAAGAGVYGASDDGDLYHDPAPRRRRSPSMYEEEFDNSHTKNKGRAGRDRAYSFDEEERVPSTVSETGERFPLISDNEEDCEPESTRGLRCYETQRLLPMVMDPRPGMRNTWNTLAIWISSQKTKMYSLQTGAHLVEQVLATMLS